MVRKLEQLIPNITYLQYKKISNLIHESEDSEKEYYGNRTDWKIIYIILSDLINFLNKP